MSESTPRADAEAAPVADVIEAKTSPDPTPLAPAPAKPFSWLDPHPIFVIVFAGAEEKPFGIQKDFLCSKSRYFRDHFSGKPSTVAGADETAENDDSSADRAKDGQSQAGSRAGSQSGGPAEDEKAGENSKTEEDSKARDDDKASGNDKAVNGTTTNTDTDADADADAKASADADGKARTCTETQTTPPAKETAVEHVVHLPDVAAETFAYAQHFLYTGQVTPVAESSDGGRPTAVMPSYDTLIDVWKVGHRLGIDGLCERTLEAMAENRRLSQTIPSAHVLVQVWKDTPEGSSIRRLLLSWAAEYLRVSDERRSIFAKALPQELLSDLVVAMSSSYGDFWAMTGNGSDSANANADTNGGTAGTAAANTPRTVDISNGHGIKHYRDGSPVSGDIVMQDAGDTSTPAPAPKRARYFGSYPANGTSATAARNGSTGRGGSAGNNGNGSNAPTPAPPASTTPSAVASRKASRTSLPTQRVFSGATTGAAASTSASTSAVTTAATGPAPKRRTFVVDPNAFSAATKLRFCNDLLTRMLSGPGFWTRLVGPFRDPVDPTSDGIPDYFEKVKRPMDLGTIKAKLDDGQYASPEEFAADIRQIFANVYTYWDKEDNIWQVCERLERTFEEKYSEMNKWLSKLDADDL